MASTMVGLLSMDSTPYISVAASDIIMFYDFFRVLFLSFGYRLFKDYAKIFVRIGSSVKSLPASFFYNIRCGIFSKAHQGNTLLFHFMEDIFHILSMSGSGGNPLLLNRGIEQRYQLFVV